MTTAAADDRIILDMDDGPRVVATDDADVIDLDLDDTGPRNAPEVVAAPVVLAPVASPFCTCTPPPLAARRVGSSRTSPKFCTGCDKERAPVKANATPATTSSAPADFATVARSTSVLPEVVAAAPVEAKRQVLVKGDLVAGAAASGHGVLVGWSGLGSMTLAKIRETLAAAEVPMDWAPEARSSRAQAGNAIQMLRGRGFIVKNQTKGERPNVAAYDTLWTVARATINDAQVGESVGRIVVVFTLVADVLRYEGDAEIGDAVVAEYQRRIGAELYRAADVTHWLSNTVYNRCEGVRFGGVWYVPRKFAGVAARVCETFGKVWGTDWLLPALPVATSAQLQDGLLAGLTKEVDDVCAQLDAQRENAKEKGKEDVGQRAAASHLARIREITERVQTYGALLGDDRVDSLRTRLVNAAAEVDALIDDGMGMVQRFSQMWDEVERDMRKAAREESAS